MVDSFGVKHIPNEINEDIIANIYRIQEHNSIISGYFSIELIKIILNDKKLTDYSQLITLVYDKIILDCFQQFDNV